MSLFGVSVMLVVNKAFLQIPVERLRIGIYCDESAANSEVSIQKNSYSDCVL